MEEKIKKLIGRIEDSGLSPADKEEVYAYMAEGLQLLVWPVLAKHLPGVSVKRIEQGDMEITPEYYAGLINESVGDGRALTEIRLLMENVLDNFSRVLDEKLPSN